MTRGAYGTTSGTSERDSRPLMDRMLVFNLAEEIEALRSEHQWAENDKNSRTLAKDVDFRVLLSALHTGATLDEEDGDARASIQVVEGGADLDVAGEVTTLETGHVAVVNAGQPWVLRATSDCAVLLTLAWPIEKAGV
jgi:quercetin dioxygenase-like cupin family protein